MTGENNEILQEFNKIDKEFNELYHEAALKMNLSDSAFMIFYVINHLGDGCLQRDICHETFVNKQTIHSSIRKLEQQGYLYLKQGKGRDKHIFLTQNGKNFIKKHIIPVVQKENEAFAALQPQEQKKLLELSQKYIKNLKMKLNEILC